MEKVIGEIKSAFEDFKKTNNEILEAKASGKAVGELEAKLAKIEGEIVKQEDIKKQLEDIQVAMKRGGSGVESKEGKFSERAEVLSKYMKKGENALSEKEMGILVDKENKFLSVQSDPDGGYSVLPDTSGRIATQIFETSPLRSLAFVQTIGTDALEGTYDDDEPAASWAGETQARIDTATPQIGKYRIPAHEQFSKPKATQKLLEDSSVNIEQWLERKVTSKFARAEATSFVSGDGVVRPRGFLTYAASADADVYERETIGQVETAASLSIGFDDLIGMLYKLKAGWRMNSTWAMNRRTFGAIRKLKDADNQYLWEPSTQIGQPATLLGRPTSEFDDLPDVAANTLSVALADWNAAYTIVDRLGVSVLRDPFSSKPYVEFYTRKRVGGAVVGFDAIKLLKIKS